MKYILAVFLMMSLSFVPVYAIGNGCDPETPHNCE